MIIKDIILSKVPYSTSYPDQCPLCYHYSEIRAIKVELVSNDRVEVIFQCGFKNCESFFIGYYEKKYGEDIYYEEIDEWSYNPFELILKNFKPTKAPFIIFPESIIKISPFFISIYQEAEHAKHLGLTQIAGPGYRKAFEFLIKDYAKKLNPNDSNKIEKTFSGGVIDQHLNDIRIKEMSKRLLWLGNDESHYLRKWTEHNLDDLITLIHLVIDDIDKDERYNHYLKNMKEKS